MSDKKVLKKTDKVVARKIEGEMILLPLYKSSMDMNYIYTLNESAARFWDLVNGKNSIADIKADLLTTYNVDKKMLDAEIDGLIKDLKSVKAVK